MRERAVELARRSEIPLKIAAKIDRANQEYWIPPDLSRKRCREKIGQRSIWPHDNALIASGLSFREDKTLAVRILRSQLEAST